MTKNIEGVALRAIALNEQIKEAEEELEGLKEQLRDSAMVDGWREMVTSMGSVRAAFVDPVMGAAKGKAGALVSLLPLHTLLPADHFAWLFEAKLAVTLTVKDPLVFDVRLGLLTPQEQEAVLALVEAKPSAIRITLPRRKE
jgi:hypothetical protein